MGLYGEGEGRNPILKNESIEKSLSEISIFPSCTYKIFIRICILYGIQQFLLSIKSRHHRKSVGSSTKDCKNKNII